jgi:cytochrome c biogenesis protein
MRFAVSMLTVLGIASIIGTVLVQNQPYQNYIIKFGQFWFGFFEMLGLYDVYHSAWFLIILVFLVLSTSLCVFRNSPLMIKEWKAFKEQATEKSFKAFSHQAHYQTQASSITETQAKLAAFLKAKGYQYKFKTQEDGAELIAAKAGTHQRLGYIFTHTAIVVICLGGLLDGNLPFKIQEVLGHKVIEKRNIPESEVPKESRLTAANLSFRGNMTLPEGHSGNVAFLQMKDGYIVQELPFSIGLKDFHIEHYATGQPKKFESDIVIQDPNLKAPIEAKVSVNHPYTYKGISIYQSDFQDGGTGLDFNVWNLFTGEQKPHEIKGEIFQKSQIGEGANALTVEYNDFRKFNIINLEMDVKAKPKNVGPNITYKLRDAQGQAKEYVNYMQPLNIDNVRYFVTGVRETVQEEFKYLRIPVDPNGEIDGFMAFKSVLMDKANHALIANRLASYAVSQQDSAAKQQFINSTQQLLSTFVEGGYDRVGLAIEKSVPEDKRAVAAKAYLKILGMAGFEAYNMGLEMNQQPVLERSQVNETMIIDTLSAFSDMFYFGAPFYLQLTDFQHKEASGLQLTKSPGQFWVYLGSCLLVIGIFSMFYIRERRIWLLLKPATNEVQFAMSSNRKNLDFDQEFALYREQIRSLIV